MTAHTQGSGVGGRGSATKAAGRLIPDPRRLTPSSGFTLLELSIVLTIIALITAMATTSALSLVATARQNSTAQKMAAIDQALLAFRNANDRLPCPASLTITAGSANYGQEAGYQTGGVGTGECVTGMTPAATSENGGAAEGAVPFAALGIPSDFMYDGWGDQIRYAVDIGMTKNGAFSGTQIQCRLGAITILDANGNARSGNGTSSSASINPAGSIYALISHGANASGAYTRGGVLLNTSSVNANELINCHCTSETVSTTAATTYYPTYVQMDPYTDTNTSDTNYQYNTFDDIVTYKERWQMQTQWDGLACNMLYIADKTNDRIRKVTMGTGIITTVAGAGTTGTYAGDASAATLAQLNTPFGVALDSSGNIYIADSNNSRIRKVVATTGVITTVAGNGTAGYAGDGSAATLAEINLPQGVALDSSGNLYFTDAKNNRIRKVTVATGVINTVAGSATTGAFAGDGSAATLAQLNNPFGVALDSSGNIYIGDSSNNRIRMVAGSTGIITTVAGSASTNAYAGDGSAATLAKLYVPAGVALDSSGNLYIADQNNYRIREVYATSGIITTIAGNGTVAYAGDGSAATLSELNQPSGLIFDSSGNLYIADQSNQRVREVYSTSGIIVTVAGNGTAAYSGDGGQATGAGLWAPAGVFFGPLTLPPPYAYSR